MERQLCFLHKCSIKVYLDSGTEIPLLSLLTKSCSIDLSLPLLWSAGYLAQGNPISANDWRRVSLLLSWRAIVYVSCSSPHPAIALKRAFASSRLAIILLKNC